MLIRMDVKTIRALQKFAMRKRMRQQLLAMNDIAFASGHISEDKYLEMRRKLGAPSPDA